MTFSDQIAAQFDRLPELLGGHMVLSLAAIAVAVAVSVPAGILATRRKGLGRAIIGASSVIQTVPSLALLALMVPLLGGTIGYLPAFIALTLYGMLPTVRNTVLGLEGIDPAIIEAARGVGMTARQRLRQVEVPLALPSIVAGIRTSTVWVIGIATLATPVGAPSLGGYIFSGLQTRNWTAVAFGCLVAAALAILLDRLIASAETALLARNRRRAALAGAALGVVALGGVTLALAPGLASSSRSGEAGPLAGESLTIGAKTFTEQFILANVIERALSEAGARTERLDNLGSTILFDALASNTVDVYVDYTGTIWATVMKRAEPVGRAEMFEKVGAYLAAEHGVRLAGGLGFENAYGFAMRRDRAEAAGISSIADLARAPFSSTIGAPTIGAPTIGGDVEFFGREDWRRVRDLYGLGNAPTRAMDSTFMYGAVRDGEVDVIGAYTTDGRIAAFDLKVLADPQGAFPPYDAIVLLSPRAAALEGIDAALAPLLGAITAEAMREANRRVDLDGASPAAAADELWRALGAGAG